MKTERIGENRIKCTIDENELLYMYNVDMSLSQQDFIDNLKEHIFDIAKDCFANEDIERPKQVIDALIDEYENR